MDTTELDFVLDKDCPIEILCRWKKQINSLGLNDPDAACLITTNNLKPSGRMVLIKDISDKGLIFFTNYNSRKANDISANPNVALLFYFDNFQKQVRIEGVCEKTSEVVSDNYFASRSYESQISAAASKQSSVMSSKKQIENTISKLKAKYPKVVPRPKDWGGFIIKPNYFEFWIRGENRTHDRVCFEKTKLVWKKTLLQP